MFILGLKGPLSPDRVRRFANDLGGALFTSFEEGENGTWTAGINDHYQDRAFALANRHGLVVLGVRMTLGPPDSSHLSMLEPAVHRLLGVTIEAGRY